MNAENYIQSGREKDQTNIYDIFSDVHDIAGILIIVNYPSRLKVASIFVAETFSEVKDPDIFSADRRVGQSWEPGSGPTSVRTTYDTVKFEDGTLDIYNDVLFKIQVITLPASLINKIAHSLHYKKEVGALSRRDEIVIDLTKELVLCYSLCLYYKDTLEAHEIRIMREAAFPLGEDVELGINKLVRMLPGIPELKNADSDAKCIPKRTFQVVFKSLPFHSGQTTPGLWKSLVSSMRFKRSRILYHPSINLPIVGQARFDSGDVYTSPKCQEGTQTAARKRIHHWINKEVEPSMRWIYTPAGTGKSTLARTMADKLTKTSQIVAGYFFKQGEASRNRVSYLFPTIASRLIVTVPHYEATLRKSFKSNPNTDIDRLSSTKVIIIDALDECDNLHRATDIIKLLQCLQDLKTLRLMEAGHGNLLPLITDYVHDISSDIEVVLRTAFGKIQTEASLEDAWLTERQFRHVLERATHPSSPVSSMPQLYSNTFTTDRVKLDQMYAIVFETLDSNTETGESGYVTMLEQKTLQKILGAIVLVAEPLQAATLDGLLQLKKNTTQRWLECLRALEDVPVLERDPVEMVHKSFSNFILKEKLKEEKWYHIDAEEVHEHLADGCLKQLETHLRNDICDTGDHGMSRLELELATIWRCITSGLEYSSLFWWHHWLRCKTEGHDYKRLYSFFRFHLLHWIECISILGYFAPTATAFNGIYAEMKVIAAVHGGLKLWDLDVCTSEHHESLQYQEHPGSQELWPRGPSVEGIRSSPPVAFSPDSQFLETSAENSVDLWRLTAATLDKHLVPEASDIQAWQVANQDVELHCDDPLCPCTSVSVEYESDIPAVWINWTAELNEATSLGSPTSWDRYLVKMKSLHASYPALLSPVLQVTPDCLFQRDQFELSALGGPVRHEYVCGSSCTIAYGSMDRQEQMVEAFRFIDLAGNPDGPMPRDWINMIDPDSYGHFTDLDTSRGRHAEGKLGQHARGTGKFWAIGIDLARQMSAWQSSATDPKASGTQAVIASCSLEKRQSSFNQKMLYLHPSGFPNEASST
ncbi:hypothetical protein NM208_g8270 [Fusarium decemcellulare]|uniref:Uncharacterized protein n=1 Tax=Fusarium decemcellulare TaxID=57161 RepID=A0ACC1S5Z0_9HYPO|nr:hypothetical protein NM208_g8270 [Fusarium decemcellulare]